MTSLAVRSALLAGETQWKSLKKCEPKEQGETTGDETKNQQIRERERVPFMPKFIHSNKLKVETA